MRRRYGERGERWLAELPGLHAGCARRWGLRLATAMTDGQMSSIVAGTNEAGQEVVLKCLPDASLARREIESLAYWGGDPGVVALLEADADRGALLMRRIRPGTKFAPGDAAERVAELLAGLHSHRDPAPPSVPSLADQIGGQLDKASRRLTKTPLMSLEAFDVLLRLAESLAEPDRHDVLLHGDMQPRNILTDEAGGGILIDPRPSVGDPAFDAGTWALKQLPIEEAPARARRIAIASGGDHDRVAGWMRILAAETALSRLHHGFCTEEDARRLTAVALGRD